jgi:hypothetical protein
MIDRVEVDDDDIHVSDGMAVLSAANARRNSNSRNIRGFATKSCTVLKEGEVPTSFVATSGKRALQ